MAKTRELSEVCPGETMLYYPGGTTKDEPIPAIVQANNGHGVLALTLIERFGGPPKPALEGIRHIDDPWFMENPAKRVQFGAWDTKEAHRARLAVIRERRRQEAEAQAAIVTKNAVSTVNETVARVYELLDEGKTPKQISKLCGMPEPDVEELIRLNPRQPAGV